MESHAGIRRQLSREVAKIVDPRVNSFACGDNNTFHDERIGVTGRVVERLFNLSRRVTEAGSLKQDARQIDTSLHQLRAHLEGCLECLPGIFDIARRCEY